MGIGEVSEEATNANLPPSPPDLPKDTGSKNFAPRENLNETVFFMPDLRTRENGDVSISFVMNEALTTWNLMLLGHATTLASGQLSDEIVTKKNLMVFPELPRFLREGDVLTLRSRINKLVDREINGTASIQIIDPTTGRDLTREWIKTTDQEFAISDVSSATHALWDVTVPLGHVTPVEVIIKAKSTEHTDGVKLYLPILSNRILVTEAMPFSVRSGKQKKVFIRALELLEDKNISPHRLTLEFTQNPVWFAIQSLPYLKEYPHDCIEQIVHRLYANALASHVAQQIPNIKSVFEEWRSKEELISNLNKNSELKSALIEESPWLRDAQSEEEQMARIGELFDLKSLADEYEKDLGRLTESQHSSGGFSWFSDGRPNVYMTQLVINVFGHLQVLGVELPHQDHWRPMIDRALQFSNTEMRQRYERLTKDAKNSKSIDYLSLQAIYTQSFFERYKNFADEVHWKYYLDAARHQWTKRTDMVQAMLATAFHRLNQEDSLPKDIIASFLDRALRSDELGMHWKHESGYYWYQRPVEAHAHMMEAVATITMNSEALEEMRIWLLKHKQTNRWSNTVSTAKALYALLLRGDDWTDTSDDEVELLIGGRSPEYWKPTATISPQSGTGYQKYSWAAAEIQASMNEVEIGNQSEVINWGSVYVQYFQDIDDISVQHDNPLIVSRHVMKKVQTSHGHELQPIEESKLKIGDRVVIRLEVKVDRMMEFVHIKDLRPAAFEPVDVISQYQYVGGLGFYQSTTDLATHFFIDHVRSGTYVIEYDAYVTTTGQFSGGMSSIQCLYAPEFGSHSEGRMVEVFE